MLRILCLFVLLTSAIPTLSQVETYIFAFPQNFRSGTDVRKEIQNSKNSKNDVAHSLSIGTSAPTTVRITVASVKFEKVLTLPARASISIELPGEEIVARNGASKHSVIVTANQPIALTAMSFRFQSTEAFGVYPVGRMGTSYVAACYSQLAMDLTGLITVVGIEDGTSVRLIGPPRSVDFDKQLALGINVTLNRGDVWSYVAPGSRSVDADPTGTIITASAPVSVITGHACAYVPAKQDACNPLYEHMLPISSLGNTTFVPPLAGRAGSIVRVISASERAQVTVGTEPTVSLGSQEFKEISRGAKPLIITTDNPTQVALYSKGYKSGDTVGDPCMITVPSTSEYARSYLLTTVTAPEWDHYITVICPPGHVGSVRLDEADIPLASFESDIASGFRWASVKTSPGVHSVNSATPFGVYVHGIGTGLNAYDAYGTGGATVLSK